MDKIDKTKYKALCDTGASSTVIGEKLANFGPITVNNSPKIFTTAMGNFTNECSLELTFQLPELSNRHSGTILQRSALLDWTQAKC